MTAGTLVFASGSDVFAGHGSHGSWGSHGSHGSYGSSGGGSSHGSYGSNGSHGSHGSHGGTTTYYGSQGLHGSYANHGAFGGTGYSQPYSSYSVAPSYENNAPVTNEDTATLEVTIPEGARLVVNGKQTTSTGTHRQFISRGLESGKTYTYRMQAEVKVDGSVLTETKVTQLRAGSTTSVPFEFDSQPGQQAEQAEPTQTHLTLSVPSESTVTLAGKQTLLTGSVRVYTTTTLSKGEEWTDYPIRVEVQRDGRTVAREQNITLVGGEFQNVSFDFETNQLAENASR